MVFGYACSALHGASPVHAMVDTMNGEPDVRNAVIALSRYVKHRIVDIAYPKQ